jgi:Ca2+-binding RTX toxin-like protein
MSRRLKVLGAAIVLLGGLAALPAQAAAFRCFGETATEVGTNGHDHIRGTGGHDVIVTRGGDDTVHAGGGFDLVCAGPGADRVFGGGGGEFLFGGEGHDKLYGEKGPFSDFAPGPGVDRAVGSGASLDFIHYEGAAGPIKASLVTQSATGEGKDSFIGADNLFGSAFGDTLTGNAVDNVLVGQAGADTLRGGDGFDWIAGQKGDDDIHGGAFFDIADYFDENFHAGLSTEGPISVDLAAGTATGQGSDTLSGIEGATGSDGTDTMIGDANDNAFFFLAGGDDTVDLGDGDDFVDAGIGADDLSGGPGTDSLGMFDAEHDPRTEGVTVDLSANSTSDNDTLSGFESAGGTLEPDDLTGDGGPNGLFSIDGADNVSGGGGDDLVDPGNGADDASGGAGVDLLGNLDHYKGGLTIDLSDGSNSDGDTLAGFEDLIGTDFDDILTGDNSDNAVFGSRGADVLSGLAGADLLSGDGGFDAADGGDGSDRCQAEEQQSCEFAWSRSRAGRSDGKFNLAYPWRSTLRRLGVNHLYGVAR